MLPEMKAKKIFQFDTLEPIEIQFDAEVDNKVLLTETLTRHIKNPGITQVSLHENGMIGEFFIPEGNGPFPCVLELGGSEGGLYPEKAALLASHGYATLSLAYFGYQDLPKPLFELPLEYFETALTWLQNREETDENRLGVIGISKGGELALLLASFLPKIRAVVSYVGSSVVWQGIGSGRPKSSWSRNGEALPYISMGFSIGGMVKIIWASMTGRKLRLLEFYKESLNPAAIEKASIPIENTEAALLFFSTENDLVWPSKQLASIAMERLQSKNFSKSFEHISYPGAGHLLFFPYQPTTVNAPKHPNVPFIIEAGGTAALHAAAQKDAWEKTLSFLKKHLSSKV